MKEFTPEFIAEARTNLLKKESTIIAKEYIADMLNHIEQQAKRIAELEHYEKLLHEWVHERVEGLDNLEEIEKMVRLVDDINRKNAGVACGWCDEKFDTKDEIKQHAMICKDNPLAKRIAELEELLDVVEDKKQTVFEVLENTITRRDERIAELEHERQEMDARITAYEADDPYLPIRYEPQPPKDGEE